MASPPASPSGTSCNLVPQRNKCLMASRRLLAAMCATQLLPHFASSLHSSISRRSTTLQQPATSLHSTSLPHPATSQHAGCQESGLAAMTSVFVDEIACKDEPYCCLYCGKG